MPTHWQSCHSSSQDCRSIALRSATERFSAPEYAPTPSLGTVWKKRRGVVPSSHRTHCRHRLRTRHITEHDRKRHASVTMPLPFSCLTWPSKFTLGLGSVCPVDRPAQFKTHAIQGLPDLPRTASLHSFLCIFLRLGTSLQLASWRPIKVPANP